MRFIILNTKKKKTKTENGVKLIKIKSDCFGKEFKPCSTGEIEQTGICPDLNFDKFFFFFSPKLNIISTYRKNTLRK